MDLLSLDEKTQIIIRQTDYSEATALEKLVECQGDPIKVIKLYMGIAEKKALPVKSLNQEIYKQIRGKLDDSIRSYNLKQEEKLKEEINTNLLHNE